MSSKKSNKSSRRKYRAFNAFVTTTTTPSTSSASFPIQTSPRVTTIPSTHTHTTSTTASTTGPRVTSIFTSSSGTDPIGGLNYTPLRYISSSRSLAPRTSVTFDYISSEGFVPPPNFAIEPQYSQERTFGPRTDETVNYTSSNFGSRNVTTTNSQFPKSGGFQSTSQSGFLTSSIFGKIRCSANDNLPPPPFGSHTTNSHAKPHYVPPFNSQHNTPQYRPPFSFQTTQLRVSGSTQPISSYQLNPRYVTQSSFLSGPNVTSSFGTTSGHSTDFNTQNKQQHVSQSIQAEAAQSSSSSGPNSTRNFANLFNQQNISGHGTQSNSSYASKSRGIENQPPPNSAHSQIIKSSTYFASKNKTTAKSAPYANTGSKTKANITYSQAANRSTHATQRIKSSVFYESRGTRTTDSSTLESQQNRLPQPNSNFSVCPNTPTTALSGGPRLQQNPLSGLNTDVTFSNLNNPNTSYSEENILHQNRPYSNDIIFGEQPDYRYAPQPQQQNNENKNNDGYATVPLPQRSNLQYEFGVQSQEKHIPQTDSVYGPTPLNFVTQTNSTFASNPNGVYSLNQTRIPLYPNNEFDSQSVPSTTAFQNMNALTNGIQNINFSTSDFQNTQGTTTTFPSSNTSEFNYGIGNFAVQSETQFEPNSFLSAFTGLDQPGPSTSNANTDFGIGTSSGPSISSLMHEYLHNQSDLIPASQPEHSYNPDYDDVYGYPNWSTFDSRSIAETSTAFGPAVEGQPGAVPVGHGDIFNMLFSCSNISPYETRQLISKLADMIKGNNLLQAIKLLIRMVNQELTQPFSTSCRCSTHCSYLQVVPAAYILDYLLRAATTYRNQNVDLEYVYIEHLEVIMLEDENHFPVCKMQIFTRVLPRHLPKAFI